MMVAYRREGNVRARSSVKEEDVRVWRLGNPKSFGD